MHTLEQFGQFSYFSFRALLPTLAALRQPGAVVVQLYNILLGVLPLAVVTGLALGIVTWIHLRGVSAEYVHKVPEYLAYAVVVELAPLGAGLLIAARTGASLGAELGSMRLTEQLDALEVLGQPPLYKLIGPRVLGCMLALPVLTIFVAFVSIGGSYFAEMLGGELSWTQYRTDCLSSLTPGKMIPANLKTLVFGYLVGVTGCYHGMTATGGTEGVGVAATRGVVMSIFLVMIANVVLVKLIQIFN